MELNRYILLVLDNEEKKCELLNGIPNWEYRDKLESDLRWAEYSFKLINRVEDIQVYFKKIKDCVYTSMNVFPYNTKELTEICEPQETDIHNDILFKLCMGVKKKFVNLEMRCGIIPCVNDEI